MPDLQGLRVEQRQNVCGIGAWAGVEVVGIDIDVSIVVALALEIFQGPAGNLRREAEAAVVAEIVFDRNPRDRQVLAPNFLAGFVEIEDIDEGASRATDRTRARV